MGASLLVLAESPYYCFLSTCFPGCAANHPEALLAKITNSFFALSFYGKVINY